MITLYNTKYFKARASSYYVDMYRLNVSRTLYRSVFIDVLKSLKQSEEKLMTKVKSIKRAVSRVMTTLTFKVDKSSLITEATHNNKHIAYTLKQVYAFLLDDVATKKESKANFNAYFLRVLLCDRKAKENNECKNTCYDRYYKLLDFLQNEVFDSKLKAKYRNKYAKFNKRN